MAGVDKAVEIDGEIFTIDTIPNSSSKLVITTRDELLGDIDLKSLVADLGKLGNFIRVAYNGVAGHTELQISVQRVGYKITKLSDKSAVTVHSFKTTSREVLQELKGTYEFLLDGLEEMALETLSGLGELAGKMAKAAEELHDEFNQASEDVVTTLEATQTAKGTEEKEKERLRKQQQEFEMQRKQNEALQRGALEAEQEAQQLYREAQKREDDAYDKANSLWTKLSDSVGKVFEAGAAAASLNPKKLLEKIDGLADSSGVHKDRMQRANEEKLKALEDTQKQREIRRNANQQCLEFAERIKNCADDESLAQVAIEALHESIGALKSLSATMMKACLFWKQMQMHCEALSGEDVTKLIERALKFPDEQKRLKVWTSKAFKSKAVNYYSKWVALDNVCEEYMVQIKETRADLYSYLQENPTIKESRIRVRELAARFTDDLKRDQKAIEEKESKAAQEMDTMKEVIRRSGN